jgi:hypothetical protein
MVTSWRLRNKLAASRNDVDSVSGLPGVTPPQQRADLALRGVECVGRGSRVRPSRRSASTARRLAVALLAVMSGLGARPAFAQPAEPEPTNVRVRIGPLQMNPTISLTNFGVDQNVFNDPPENTPKRDLTATLTPTLDLWLRAGRTRLTGSVKEEIVWYQKYASERSANTTYAAAWRVPLNRLLLQAGWKYARLKDRPGYEIDARSARSETGYTGVAEIRALSKTLVGVNAARQYVTFAAAAVFRDINLHDELNSMSTILGLSVRHELTPLTSVSLNATRTQDRFAVSSLRDSDSSAVVGAIALNSFAVIRGTANFGFRDFKPLSPEVPGYRGTVGAADLSYTLLGATRVTLTAKRDVQYSYERTQPYFLETGFDASVAQQIFGPVDAVARIGRHKLAYRTSDLADPTVIGDRVDRVKSYGIGLGLHLGRELRLGFNLDHIRRDSERSDRRYENLRFGTAITYGL